MGSVGGQGEILKRKATGSESGTFTVTCTGSVTGQWLVYRITGWSGSIGAGTGNNNITAGDVMTAAVVNEGPTTLNPPSLNPSAWDTDDTLWIVSTWVAGNQTVSAFPSGYTNTYSASGDGATLAVCSTTTTGAASEDPGTFTVSGGATWNSNTLAIRALYGPTIQHGDTQSGVVTSNSTSWTLTYPTNIASGDLLLAFMAIDGSSTGAFPAGWEEQSHFTQGAVSWIGAVKSATGSETGTFSVTTSSEQGAWMILRITNWFGGSLWITQSPSANTGADTDSLSYTILNASGSATLDPPSDNPANWDVEDTLWFAIASVDTSRTFSAYPTGYLPGSSIWDFVSGGAGGASLSVQYKRATAGSEDPGTFTISTADDNETVTLAVRPAAPAAALVLTQGFTDFNDPGIV